MTELVIGLCMAAGLAAWWVLRQYRRFVEDARAVNALIQQNAAKPRPGMDRPERRRFEIVGRRVS